MNLHRRLDALERHLRPAESARVVLAAWDAEAGRWECLLAGGRREARTQLPPQRGPLKVYTGGIRLDAL